MRKNYLLALVSLLALWVLPSQADEVQNYTYDFNSPYAEYDSRDKQYNSHEAAPPGWGHIKDGIEGWSATDYPAYWYYSNGGIDDSGCLRVASQLMTDEYDDQTEVYDLLVTPLVKGKITLWAKGTDVKFFNVTEKNGAFVRGSEIKPDSLPTLTSLKWQKIVINDIPDYQYIGIRVSYAYVDDFTADYANIVVHPALSLSKLKSNMTSSYKDVDADGNFTVSYDVNVKNSGPIDIQPGTEGYSLSIFTGTDTIATQPITKPLAQGADTTITVTGTINIKDFPAGSNNRFDVAENITGNNIQGSYVQLYPHEGNFRLLDTDRTEYYPSDSTYNFGTSQKPITKEFELRNEGGSALTISGITYPDGFSSDLATPLTLAAHQNQKVNITLDNKITGEHNGKIDFALGDQTFTLNVAGTIVDSTKYFVDFEDGKLPASIAAGSSWSVVNFPYNAKIQGNHYSAQANATTSKLVTPLLKVNNGDVLSFEAGKNTAYGADGSTLNVYYSKDKENWTLARTISDTGDDAFSDETLHGIFASYTYYKLKKYTVSNIPAGNWYIAFEAGNVNLDNIAGFEVVPVAHNLSYTALDIPSTAKVNKASKITATVKNSNDKDEAADSYKAVLYIDGNPAVTAATAPKIASGDSQTFTFDYTPHAAGTQSAYVAIVLSDDTIKSETSTIEVAPETAANTVQVGTSTGNNTSYAPVSGQDHYSQSEIVYTPADLNLSSGTKITRIAFQGKLNETLDFDKVNVYIANTDSIFGASQKADKFLSDTTKMTKIHSGAYKVIGNKNNEVREVLSIDIPDGFIYTGNNIRLVFDSHTAGYKTIYYTATSSNKNILFRQDDDKVPSTKEFNSYNNVPVVWLDVEKTPNTLSGKVTKASDGSAVANQPIVLTNGDVQYADTTDADGNYSITIYQDSKNYGLDIEIPGYMPVRDSVNVGNGSVVKNIALEEATNLYIESSDIDKQGTVNHAFNASVNVLNPTANDIKASDYTATLFFNGEKFAEAQTKDLKSGEKATLQFTKTPHEALENAKAVIVLNYNDKEAKSDTTIINIAAEVTFGVFQTGDSTTLTSSAHQPVNTTYRYSETDVIYPADKITVPQGASITGVFFRGTRSGYSDKNPWYAAVKVYIENTDEPVPAKQDAYYATHSVPDTASMTKVYDGDVYINTNFDTIDTIFSVTFDEPFVYTGKNIRTYIVYDAKNGVNYQTPKVISDGSAEVEGAGFSRYDDSELNDRTSWYQDNMPVAYFVANNDTKLTGKVTNEDGDAIAGASVNLASGEVLYNGTTDENGEYSISVPQATLDYDVVYTAEGYEPDTVKVSFGGASQTQDVVLAKAVEALAVVSITPADSVLTGKYPELGIYIKFNKDVTVKTTNPSVTFTSNKGESLEPDDTWKALIDEGQLHIFGLDYDGYTQTFTLDPTATYTVTIPAGVVQTADGEENEEIVITLYGSEDAKNGTTDGINGISADGNAASKAVGIYSVNGAKLGTLERGVNIVKYADGTTKKIIRK